MWTDSAWNVRECLLQVGGEKDQTFHLYSDGQGHWTDAAGVAYPTLDSCLDIDISSTPFTNTLPVRRLALTPGESEELLVAYITVPDLSIRPVQQRYTCLSRTACGGIYRYEGLESNFTADLLVDVQGLVVDYPGIWKRAEMRPLGDGISSQPRAVLEGLLASGPHPELTDKLQLFGQFVGDWEVDWTGYQPGSVVGRTGIRTLTARPVGEEIWVEGPNLKGQPLRWIFSQITSHSFHWSNFISEDGEQTWRLQEELEAHRMA